MRSYGWATYWDNGLPEYMSIGTYNISFEVYIPNSTNENRVSCGIHNLNGGKEDTKRLENLEKEKWIKVNKQVEIRANQNNRVSLQAYDGRDDYKNQIMKFRNVSVTFDHY